MYVNLSIHGDDVFMVEEMSIADDNNGDFLLAYKCICIVISFSSFRLSIFATGCPSERRPPEDAIDELLLGIVQGYRTKLLRIPPRSSLETSV